MRRMTQITAKEEVAGNQGLREQARPIRHLFLQPYPTMACKGLNTLHVLILCLLFLSVSSIQNVNSAPQSKSAGAKETNLWKQIPKGFRLPGKQHKRSRLAARWYKNNPEYLTRVSKRAQPFLYLVAEAVKKRNMPAEIALLPIVESAFQPYALSSGKASGIWQFIPTTGQRFKLKKNWWYDGHKDIVESSRAALDYLQKLHRKFDGDWLLAVAAYNCGEGRVARAISLNRKAGRSTRFWSLKLPKETRDYVPQLLGLAQVISKPEAYGIKLLPIPNHPIVANVGIGSQIDLALIAKLAKIDLQTIYDLNPAFNQWATSPNGPHQILLPISQQQKFKSRLTKLQKKQRLKIHRYKIKSGDTLSGIAKRHDSSTRAIQDVNNISGHLVAVGREILIPKPKQNEIIYTASRNRSRNIATNQVDVEEVTPLYIVQTGDSLWKIGHENNISSQQLSDWNKIALNDRLLPGQQLIIKSPKKQKNSLDDDLRKKILYRVRRGDSLWLISRKFKVAIKEIRVWNDLPNTHYLRPGRKLIIFV